MKVFFSLLIIVMTNTALANDFECSKKISDTRTEGAYISSFPYISIFNSFSECISAGSMEHCSRGVLDLIADDHSVCFQSIDAKSDCSIHQTITSLEIACSNGYTLAFAMDNNSNGKIECLQNGIPRKTWDVGSCKAK